MTHPPAQLTRARSIRSYFGPALVVLSAVCMLIWSWGTWPDPLVDFGAQLYLPWQLSAGKVLYRDLAYYNGPISQYFNATIFAIAGISLRSLVIVNLFILAATMMLAYRLTVRASGQRSAIIGGLTFALVFAFGQIVPIGNYNWVTPYVHELTHGTALGLLAIACVNRYQRKDDFKWLVIAGLIGGCVFLTKAEPAAATFASVAVQLVAGWWSSLAAAKSMTKSVLLFAGSAFVVPALFTIYLASKMPLSLAVHGVLGSWCWVFDRRVTSLAFYHKISGLNDIPGNAGRLLRWCCVYLLTGGFAVALGWIGRRRRMSRVFPALVFVIVLVLLLSRISQTDWSGVITPLPILLGVIAISTGTRILHRSDQGDRGALRLALIIFSFMLLLKMGLNVVPYHYGFVLALPGTVVLISAVAEDLPAWLAMRGGSDAAVVRAVGLAAWSVAVLAMLRRDSFNFESRRWSLGTGTADEFRSGSNGLEVQQVCDQIRALTAADGTVAVFPQGLMVNYLTRRVDPSRTVNFMPPEVMAAGEDNIIAGLNRQPPDVVVIDSSSIRQDHFTLDGQDAYGAKTLKWISSNYTSAGTVILPEPMFTNYHFVVLRRREAATESKSTSPGSLGR